MISSVRTCIAHHLFMVPTGKMRRDVPKILRSRCNVRSSIPAVRYSTRTIRRASHIEPSDFTVKPKDVLQQLTQDDLSLLNAPVCINGKWFLPATRGQSEQLDALWEDARPEPHAAPRPAGR